MKKHLLNRNEQLFNKLFENQGISIKELDVAQKTAWVALEEDEEENIDESSVNLIADPDKRPNDEEDTEAAASDPDSDEEELPESVSPQAADKIDSAFDRAVPALKTIDNVLEIKDFMERMISGISDITDGRLTSSEVETALRKMLQGKSAPNGDERKELAEEKENNPWAICTASVGRKDKEKYEDCVKAVKKQK